MSKMRKRETVVWTLDRALKLVREIQPHTAAVGWHCALAGSVLIRGSSNKDLDIVCFPHNVNTGLLADLEKALRSAGLQRFRTASVMVEGWRKAGSTDSKHVSVWYQSGRRSRRIDIIVPSVCVPEPVQKSGPCRHCEHPMSQHNGFGCAVKVGSASCDDAYCSCMALGKDTE